jgi:hypothetical protein
MALIMSFMKGKGVFIVILQDMETSFFLPLLQ